MTDNLYDALELCLQALEQGADVESCLARYPALAGELRPLLETAFEARAAAPRDVPAAAMRRGRARLLRQASELREQRRAAVAPHMSQARQWGRGLRLGLASLATVAFLLSGGSGLVFASSGSLPGDQLYPVKRSWEGVQLFFIFDPAARTQLENHFEAERVDEIHGLFSESRLEQVSFQGIVESQQDGFWQIAGLKILVEHETVLTGQITPGSLVEVLGETEDGLIKAEEIRLLAAPSATPTLLPTLRPSATMTIRVEETKEPDEAASETQEKSEAQETQTEDAHKAETPEAEKTESSSSNSGSGSSNTPKPDDSSGSGGGGGGGGDDGGGGH